MTGIHCNHGQTVMWGLAVQAEVQAKFEEEFASYEAGLYREQPRDWLATSWQGDALQVASFCMRHAELSGLPVHSYTCLQQLPVW